MWHLTWRWCRFNSFPVNTRERHSYTYDTHFTNESHFRPKTSLCVGTCGFSSCTAIFTALSVLQCEPQAIKLTRVSARACVCGHFLPTSVIIFYFFDFSSPLSVPFFPSISPHKNIIIRNVLYEPVYAPTTMATRRVQYTHTHTHTLRTTRVITGAMRWQRKW